MRKNIGCEFKDIWLDQYRDKKIIKGFIRVGNTMDKFKLDLVNKELVVSIDRVLEKVIGLERTYESYIILLNKLEPTFKYLNVDSSDYIE